MAGRLELEMPYDDDNDVCGGGYSSSPLPPNSLLHVTLEGEGIGALYDPVKSDANGHDAGSRDGDGDSHPSGRDVSNSADEDDGKETKLILTFVLMVIVGTGNKVFQKLQAVPMYNYPNSLNLLQNFVYVPLCFAYILPVARFGLLGGAITPDVTRMSKRPFAVMGALDCVTCILFTFAAVYLPGSLVILLPQAAIPISMILSRKILGERYGRHQYAGAVVVVAGIMVVLEPLVTSRHAPGFVCEAFDEERYCALCSEETTEDGCLSHGFTTADYANGTEDSHGESFTSFVANWAASNVISMTVLEGTDIDAPGGNHDRNLCRWLATNSSASASDTGEMTTLVWSIVMIFACIPLALSSIYKEKTLGGSNELDPIFLNGWVAWFQFLFGLVLAVPAGMTSSPPVFPADLPRNIWEGFKCYLGMSTIEGGCHPDDACAESPLYVNTFIVFNIGFNILMIYILKYGSANVLFMASTVMVPIGNLVFALPFVPGSTALRDSDVAGLVIIMLGLVLYRFGEKMKCLICSGRCLRSMPPLRWMKMKCPTLVDDGFSWDDPMYDDEVHDHLPATEATERLIAPLI